MYLTASSTISGLESIREKKIKCEKMIRLYLLFLFIYLANEGEEPIQPHGQVEF